MSLLIIGFSCPFPFFFSCPPSGMFFDLIRSANLKSLMELNGCRSNSMVKVSCYIRS